MDFVSEPGQVQVRDDLGSEQARGVREAREPYSREDFLRDAGTTDDRPAFEDEDLATRFREIPRGNEAVVAAADDDGVPRAIHVDGSARGYVSLRDAFCLHETISRSLPSLGQCPSDAQAAAKRLAVPGSWSDSRKESSWGTAGTSSNWRSAGMCSPVLSPRKSYSSIPPRSRSCIGSSATRERRSFRPWRSTRAKRNSRRPGMRSGSGTSIDRPSGLRRKSRRITRLSRPT